jgi:(1->4)-alpha-D-glucan 1-alpha-D-glucosylmutase
MAVPLLRATYRLQFHKDFTFADGRAQIPYLARLGISHLYASPILMSRAGSTHGYDGIDPSRIDPELGGEEGFADLAEACRTHGMGIILDIVPNHMAVDSTNPLWMEALEFGPQGPAGSIFDIDWAQGPVVIAALGKTLFQAVADGEIALRADWSAGRFVAAYFDNQWPLRPEAAAAALQMADTRDGGSLAGLSNRWQAFEEGRPTKPDAIAEARTALRDLDTEKRALVDDALARMDVTAVLRRQHWRVGHWRTENDSLTYRRFFNISGLVGVRVEDTAVFDIIHAVPLRLLREGLVEGLRIDHVDGLADPTSYCAKLRDETGPDAILLVEKILCAGEALRPWPITGTTGYERLNDINGLFVHREGWRTLDRYLADNHVLDEDLEARLAAAKSFMLRNSFMGEVETLARLALTVCRGEPADAEFNIGTLREAVLALLIRFPAYRSYGPDTGSDPADRALWETTLARVAALDTPWVAEAARSLIARLASTSPRSPGEEFIRRFQQLSGPAMAKGLEDTEFYRSVGLTSVNEVGGDLLHPWRDAAEFHAIYAERAATRRQDLIPLATHDTKRGPETRARINAISHNAAGWIAGFEAWRAMNTPLRGMVGAEAAPDVIDEWLIYQTLAGASILGAGPITTERMAEYLTKAMREAKRRSFWDNPNDAYETAVQEFARALIEDAGSATFRAELAEVVAGLDHLSRVEAIAQTILQLTLPGTPDIYQGTEFWDFSLVDPDNRRLVDYAARATALAEAGGPDLAANDLGTAKLAVTHRLLTLRAEHPGLFTKGDYKALALGDRWLGFTRSDDAGTLMVVVPTAPLAAGNWPSLPAPPVGVGGAGSWRCALTDASWQGVASLDPAFPFIVATHS